jgi:hypothetical protein
MQFDFGTIDPNVETGSELAADLNQWRTALHSTHGGVARPAYAAPGMLWLDQTDGFGWNLKMATATGDVVLHTVNSTTNTVVSMGNVANVRQVFNATPGHNISQGWNDGTSKLDLTVDANAFGGSWPISITGRADTVATVGGAGGGVVSTPVEVRNTGWDGASWWLANVVLVGSGGTIPGIGLHREGVLDWKIALHDNLRMGNGTGPGTLSGSALFVNPDGNCYARAFNPVTFAATNPLPMTDALSGVLKLRGVRCVNTETQRPAIRLEVDDVAVAFPELIEEMSGESGPVKAINYMALAAPIIEAIREINDRMNAAGI